MPVYRQRPRPMPPAFELDGARAAASAIMNVAKVAVGEAAPVTA